MNVFQIPHFHRETVEIVLYVSFPREVPSVKDQFPHTRMEMV